MIGFPNYIAMTTSLTIEIFSNIFPKIKKIFSQSLFNEASTKQNIIINVIT